MKNIIPTVHVLTVVALYIACAYVGYWAGSPVVWFCVWIVMGGLLTGAYVLVHETVHNIFFSSRLLNRILGTVAAMLTLDVWSYYRAWHYAHHMHLGTVDDSEDDFVFTNKSDYVFQCLAYIPQLHNAQEYSGSKATSIWKQYVTDKATSTRFDFLMLGVWIGAVFVGAVLFPVFVTSVYVVPLLISMKFVFFLDVAEHYGVRESGDVFHSTRTVFSNRLVQFFIFNANFHTAHHNAHTSPYYKLRAETEHIRPLVQNYEKSYVGFHIQLVKDLPN